ncbi:MAG: GNAT family N-acetyltransferase [Clostridiales bacterium]|nr:GNAT family N-acetyltransferase [Clostridiales bacterium]
MVFLKTFHTLPEEAVYIRNTVFVEEQGFKEEFDETDDISAHIIIYEDEEPAGVCRFYYDGKKQAYILGRLAVIKEFRKRSFGAKLIREAERQVKALKGEKLCLAAQVRAKGFYEKQGYKTEGEEFSEENCPHIMMYKNLINEE